jgi:hypothetical protein
MTALDKMPLEVMPENQEETLEKNAAEEEVIQARAPKNRNSIFEQWTDKFKEFLDKA